MASVSAVFTWGGQQAQDRWGHGRAAARMGRHYGGAASGMGVHMSGGERTAWEPRPTIMHGTPPPHAGSRASVVARCA